MSRIVAIMPQIRPAVIDPRFDHWTPGWASISRLALLPFTHAIGPSKPQITRLRIPSTNTVVPAGCSRTAPPDEP